MIFFATCPLGLADLLALELKEFGAIRTRELKSGVEFEGSLEQAYRACLWSRTANRILLQLGNVPAHSAAALYEGVRTIDWSQHLSVSGTLAVDLAGQSTGITHTQFGALKTKDAIVDQFRAKFGERPSVDVDRPDVRINVHLHRDTATLALDLSGESLHRRGYRARGVAAPLKENLAAGLLLRAGWPAIATQGGALLDPLCGSGTLVIEAALMALDIAPGLMRNAADVAWGFSGWREHDTSLWNELLQQAEERRRSAAARDIQLRGYDHDAFAVRAALENVEHANLRGKVHIERRQLADLSNGLGAFGLIVANPPYGERIGDQDHLRELYASLGERMRDQFVGWKAAVFTGNPPLARELKIIARRSHTLFNGPLECRLLRFDVDPEYFDTPEARPTPEQKFAVARERPGAQMFANRLRKNHKTFSAWARREQIGCYRLYDADMPEYAFAIDMYGSADDPSLLWVYVQEYAAPETVERDAARIRRLEVLSVLPEVLDVPRERIHVRTRKQQKGTAQYEKLDERGEFCAVAEGRYRFLVNFTDYLDTGLFLDHRLTRRRIGELAQGKRFLNLFAYTGTATVHAVGGGASASTTVDLSKTYLDWAKRNLAINRLATPEHGFVHADCLQWLREAAATRRREFDLIFIDPPTFSRSKRMDDDFDVQRDHVKLIKTAANLLSSGGLIVFSNNYSRFKLDLWGLSDYTCTDISRATIPKDFERSPRIHCCYLIEQK